MSWANVVGFFMDLATNPLFWLFIVFWGIYAKTKKMWAKATAIIFTVIGFITFISTCYYNFWI